jgi:hypothetical protein
VSDEDKDDDLRKLRFEDEDTILDVESYFVIDDYFDVN